MDRQRRAAIGHLAERIRTALETDGPPYDPEVVAKALGGRIVEDSDLNHEATVEKRGERSFLVRIRPDLPEVRRRFTVAHELGHLFLHMGYVVNPARWKDVNEYVDSPMARFGHGEEEYEAHEFAGSFLMPEAQFRRVAAQHLRDGKYSVAPIAEHFGVSVAAATTRGRWLRLFSWD